jgi:uncharacterized membrane protein (DUF373 family)
VKLAPAGEGENMSDHASASRGNPFAREAARLIKICRESSPYESFEHVITLVLIALIMVIAAVATWSLVREVWEWVSSDQIGDGNWSGLQKVFGNIFTIIIALEFKTSLRINSLERKEAVRGRTIMLIALVAVARKFILLDLHEVAPLELCALAAAALALGVVFWLFRDQEPPRVAIQRGWAAASGQRAVDCETGGYEEEPPSTSRGAHL